MYYTRKLYPHVSAYFNFDCIALDAMNCSRLLSDNSLYITELCTTHFVFPGHKGSAESLSPDLFVICAESAITINLVRNYDLIEEALTFYLALKPKENQFLARSYLCHAHLHKPASTRDTDKLAKCSSYILKTIDFGKQNSRYHFLVVNASILFWKLARPFLVLQSIHHVVNTLGAIVKALTIIDDPNKKWLLSVSVSYIESLYRNDQADVASKETQTAIKLAKTKCPEQLSEVICKLSNYGLVSNSDMTDLPLNLVIIYETNTLKSKLKLSSDLAGDNAKISKTVGNITKKILDGKGKGNLDPDTSNDLLLDVLLIALQYRVPNLAQTCLDGLQKPFTDVNFDFRVKFAEADLTVKNLGDEEQSYKKSILNVRMKSIFYCQETLVAAIKQCDSSTVQSGCITLWNLCLPMLQHNLRHQIVAPLKLIVTALEDLQSMLVLLRCQVHIELAKCYQDKQKLIEALENFNKALNLDPDGQYKETIMYHMKCINLKTNLYKKPDTIEEKAGFLLEQAKSAKTAKTNLHPILLKIGEYLAPNTFNWGIKELGENSQNCASLMVLKDKITKYREAKEKSNLEMNRLTEANTHERFILWADVAKLARKEEVWDVALTASRFALWFEDQFSISVPEEDPEPQRKSTVSRAGSIRSEKPQAKESKSRLSNLSKSNAILVAELNFIYAESLIFFMMQENISLGEGPKLPRQLVESEDELIRHIDYPQWEAYCTWIKEIQEECITHFIKGGQQGMNLREWWLVNNACVYIWNYLKRTIDNNNHSNVIEWLSQGYNLMISSRGNADFVLACQYVEALVQGYLNKHRVKKLLSDESPSSSRKTSPSRTPSKPKSGKKSVTPAAKGKGGKKDAKDSGLNLDPTLIEDITKAIQIAETVYQQIIGKTTVGLPKRKALLCLWVTCKQVLGQPLRGSLLPDEDKTDTFSVACKSIVAVEMNHLNTNNYYLFPSTPSMQETLKMIDSSEWEDKLIELEIWTKLASLSLKVSNKEMIDTCCERIKKLQDHPDFARPSCKITANKLLCYHNLILGKSELSFSTATSISDRAPAFNLFTNAVEAAELAKDYNLALDVVQHFWNAILPHLSKKHERALLKENLLRILKVIANLAPDKNQKIQDVSFKHKKEIDLRAHLYSTLFLIYMDEKNWTSGLEESEKAALAMPRPTHPLILKYRSLFKVNIGVSPNGDLAKLERVENEDTVSDMWHRVAMSSSNKEEQLYALQQSIMLLQDPGLRVKKIESIIRLAEWLFINQFPINDVLDQLEWALDVAVGLKSEDRGNVLMPVDQDDSFKGKSLAQTQSVRTRLTVSTQHASVSDDKIEVLSKPKPLLCYVDETMENIEEIEDVQRGEMIARILVIRSKMVLYSGGNVKQSILMAYNIYQQILSTCLTKVGQNGGASSDEKPGTRDGKKGKGNQDKLKASSKTSMSVLPESLIDWAVFKLPANASEYLKESFDVSTINKVTFPQPELSLHYMNELCHQLELFGLVDHVMPIYAVQELLAVAVLDNKHLTSLIHLKAARNCQQLHLMQGFNHHMELATAMASDDQEFVSNISELELYKSGYKHANPVPMGLDDQSTQAQYLLSGIKIYQIQVEKAEIFIESGDFKSAMTMLEQALPHIKLFDDLQSNEEYHYAAALLAACQNNYKLALHHLLEIHHAPKSLDTSSKLMKKILDILVKTDIETAENLSLKFNEILQDLQKKYKNHSYQIQYVIAQINCFMVNTKIDHAVKNELSMSAVEDLLTLCKIFEKPITIFTNLGFTLDACQAMYCLSKIKFKLSVLENGTDFHKCMFLEAMECSQKALKMLHNEINKVKNIGIAHSKLPQYMSCIIEHHCHQSNMFHHASIDYIKDEKNLRIADSQKNEIDKQIECFIAEPVALSSLDEQWDNMCYSSEESCRQHADNAVRLAQKYHLQFNSNAQLSLGTALGDTSESLFEDSLDLWKPDIKGDEMVTRTLQKEIVSLKYLTSSMEFLAQAVQIALLKQDHEVLQPACYELITRLGFGSPQTSVQYLLLYQSSLVSVWLKSLLKEALHWPTKSEIGSLITQIEQAYQAGNFQLYSQCFEELTKANSAWKRLLVFENHFDLLKEVDDKQYFLVLQHSPCKEFLFSALVQGSKSAGKAVGENQVLKISRCEVSFEKLESLQRMFENYRLNVERYMIKLVQFYKARDQSNERKVVLEQLGVDENNEILTEIECAMKEARENNEQFYRTIVSQLWDYVKDAVEVFVPDLNMIQDQESNFSLLPDNFLQSLPLEALPISKIGNIKQFTRDFSIQSFHHRMLSYTHSKNIDGVPPVESKKPAKTPGPGGSAKGERVKSMLDKRLLTDKIAIQPPAVDTNNFKYILNDDAGLRCGDTDVVNEFGEMLKATQAKTARWAGTVVTDNQCSPMEMQEILTSSSGFIYCGLGKMFTLISSELLSRLNMSSNHLHIIADQVITSHVLRHQTQEKENRGKHLLKLESPLNLAGLLYLSGSILTLVNSVETSSDTNIAFLTNLIKTAVENELPMGPALHLTRYPPPPEAVSSKPPTPLAKGAKAKSPKKTDSGQESKVEIPMEINIPPSLDPGIYNMVGFGLPHLTLGEGTPVAGKK